MTTYELRHGPGPQACVVDLRGDIDIAVVPGLTTVLLDALDAGCVNIVLDLSEVTYADSSALGLLVLLDHRLAPLDGRLVLAGANQDVARILELSGLVGVGVSIATSANVDAALEGFALADTVQEPEWVERVVVPADVHLLGSVRDQVSEMIAPLGFPESAVFDVKVALGEALANAVRHGSPTDQQGEVRVDVIAYGDRLVLEVSDSGLGFDGVAAEPDDIYASSGRGIRFMHALMDRVEFERAPEGGTLVRLVKHRRRVMA
jgi:anti-anti-sigma factor